jgi:ABC-2 type transport system permease protein
LATLTIFSAVFVGHAQGLIRPEWHADFNRLLFVTQQFVVIMWILAAVLLGMGGLVREKAIGSVSLTLSLPVSRARLLGVRVALGALEAIALGVVPWVTVFITSLLGGMPVAITQVALYVLLLLGGGLVYFAMAIFVSSLIEGEYTAPAVAFGLVLLSAIILDAWFRPFNLWRLVTGDFYIDRKTFLLETHIPWLALLSSLSIASAMLLASLKVIQRREF